MKTNKLTTIFIALLLSAIVGFSTILLPTATAHNPPVTVPTYAFLVVNPNPVGVGQHVNIVMWAGLVLPGAAVTNDVRFHDYKLVITDPDGQVETKTWSIIMDTTSTQFLQYTPTKVGTYSFVFSYPDQKYTWTASSTYTNDTYLGDTSKTVQLTVQQEPLENPINSYPLPSEYWTRPIEGQNTDWWTISSQWLGASHPSIANGIRVQPDGAAPNSAHILWTKTIDEGGVIGGTNVGNTANMYYTGLSYNARFTNPIIMNGRLFYGLPDQNAGTGGGYIAVDLRTGQTLWTSQNMGTSSSAAPTFGYIYAFNSENQHGAIPPGLLFTSNFARAVNPITGQFVLNVTNVPSGTAVTGPFGEIIRYTLTNKGNTTIPSWYLASWNSSKAIYAIASLGVNQTTTVDAGTANCYDWNVSLTTAIPSGTGARFAILNDILIGSTTFGSEASNGTPDPYTFWAISLKPESRGNMLWIKNYSEPSGVTLRLPTLDPVNRLYIFREKELFDFQAYSIDSGEHVWTTKPIENASDYEYFDVTFSGQFFMPAYGNLYHAGVDGLVSCYSGKDGSLLWTNGNDRSNPKNSTYSGEATSWGYYPQYIQTIADGKVFIGTGEHSPDSPLWKGANVRAINATTGEEIWKLMGYVGFPGRVFTAVADGVFVYDNLYNQQLTAIGKGPSTMTVEAPMTASKLGESVVIRGTVTDISAGTQQPEQTSRFSSGVPAVSDESQGSWMEYVYMQKPKPTDVTGVPITINVVDANGNYREIGSTTSNDGFFSLNWKPDIAGAYIVYASFGGSQSYWPSHATSAFAVDPAPPTPSPAPVNAQPPTEMYFLASTLAIIIAIAVVGAVIVLV